MKVIGFDFYNYYKIIRNKIFNELKTAISSQHSSNTNEIISLLAVVPPFALFLAMVAGPLVWQILQIDTLGLVCRR